MWSAKYYTVNLVIAIFTGPSVFVRYNRDIIITVKVYVVNLLIVTINIFLYICSFYPCICFKQVLLYNHLKCVASFQRLRTPA